MPFLHKLLSGVRILYAGTVVEAHPLVLVPNYANLQRITSIIAEVFTKKIFCCMQGLDER